MGGGGWISQHLARGTEGEKELGGENKSGRNYLDRYCRSTPRPVFFFSFGYRSLSGQSVVRTCRSLLADAPSMFPTVAFVTAAPRRFLFSSVSLTQTLLFSLPLLRTFPLFLHFPFPFPSFPPDRCSDERLPQQQGRNPESQPWLRVARR